MDTGAAPLEPSAAPAAGAAVFESPTAPLDAAPATTGTIERLTVPSYLLSAPDAESTPQAIGPRKRPPSTSAKVAPAASE